MLVFKVLHVLRMFAAVTFLLGESTYAAVAVWRGDVKGAGRHWAAGRPPPGDRCLIFLSGIVFGLLTAATGGLDFFAGWLIAAYVMVVVLLSLSALPVIQKGLVGLPTRRSRPRRDAVQRRRSLQRWPRFDVASD